MNIFESIGRFRKSLQEIYNHIGFVKDWTSYVLDFRLEEEWAIEQNADGKDETVWFYDEDGETYAYSIMYHRFYPKAVYVGPEITGIMVDTHTDGMKYLAIFLNRNKIAAKRNDDLSPWSQEFLAAFSKTDGDE